MNWLDCKKIYIDKLEDCTDLEAESLLMYLDRYPESKDLWLDQRTGEVFSKLQNYSNDPTSAFLTEPGMFTDNNRYGIPAMKEKPYVNSSPRALDSGCVVTDFGLLEKFQNSKILIIGAGPSTATCQDKWRSNLSKYDFVWTCNNFYKAEILSDIKFDLVSLGNEVDLRDPRLLKRVNENAGCIYGFETNIFRDSVKFPEFLSRLGSRKFFYATRFFGKIGSIPRLLNLAVSLKPSSVSFVGMDGVPPTDKLKETPATIFENKRPTGPTDYDLYRKHYVLLWDYILNKTANQITFTNYGKEYEFNMSSEIVN